MHNCADSLVLPCSTGSETYLLCDFLQITLSLGSSRSRIPVSWLERQQFHFHGNPAASQGTIWITSPSQGAAQATRCLCLWKLCKVVIPLTGDRVVAGQVAARKCGHRGHACPGYSWAQTETDPSGQ